MTLPLRLLDEGSVIHWEAGEPHSHTGRIERGSGPPEEPGQPGERRLRICDEAPPQSWVWWDSWVPDQMMYIPQWQDAFSRNEGVLESHQLTDRRVGIIGLGSGGSIIASELAKAGVGNFLLADRDVLEIHNVGRHLCDLNDLGRRKTQAVADRIRARNPWVSLTLFDGDIVERRDEISSLLEQCDVIVAATDNNRSRFFLNRFAVDSGIPTVFGRAHIRASGGDVAIVRPEGPCYQCIFGNLVVDEEVSSASSGAAPAYADVEVPIAPGLSIDIQPIATMCARLVLMELMRNQPSPIASLSEDFQSPLFLWANRREGQFVEWEPMGFRLNGLSIARWYGIRVTGDPVCPVCQEDAFLQQMALDNPLGSVS